VVVVGADQPREVALLDDVGVDQDELRDAQAGELLGDERTQSADADDPDRRVPEPALALGAERPDVAVEPFLVAGVGGIAAGGVAAR
jgi:hypothetical protein